MFDLQIEETGQKNTVLTLYELTEGDMVASQGYPFPIWLLLMGLKSLI